MQLKNSCIIQDRVDVQIITHLNQVIREWRHLIFINITYTTPTHVVNELISGLDRIIISVIDDLLVSYL